MTAQNRKKESKKMKISWEPKKSVMRRVGLAKEQTEKTAKKKAQE